MKNTPIRTLLFDLGNVLLPLDIDATYQALGNLGAKPSLDRNLELFHKWERGEIAQDEFIAGMRQHLKYASHSTSILEAWYAMLLPMPDETLAWLYWMKKKFNLVLISNINHSHEQQIKKMMGRMAYSKFLRQFNGIYYSHHVGMRKPEKAFFKKVLKDQKLNPAEVLFVDDTLENIEAARGLGFACWHFDPKKNKLTDLDKVLAALH